MNSLLEPFQLDGAQVCEEDALARDQLSHDVGHKYRTRFGARAYTSHELHGGAEDIGVFNDGFPGVQANANLEGELRACLIVKG